MPKRTSKARPAHTYRAARRNLWRAIVGGSADAKWTQWDAFNRTVKERQKTEA